MYAVKFQVSIIVFVARFRFDCHIHHKSYETQCCTAECSWWRGFTMRRLSELVAEKKSNQ